MTDTLAKTDSQVGKFKRRLKETKILREKRGIGELPKGIEVKAVPKFNSKNQKQPKKPESEDDKNKSSRQDNIKNYMSNGKPIEDKTLEKNINLFLEDIYGVKTPKELRSKLSGSTKGGGFNLSKEEINKRMGKLPETFSEWQAEKEKELL